MPPRDDYQGEERRHEDRELERWRGTIDARLAAVERTTSDLEITVRNMDRSAAEIAASVVVMQRDLVEYRSEIRQAAQAIDKGREIAVQDLKDTIADMTSQDATWRVTKFQVLGTAVFALLVSIVTALVSLAAAGQLG